jgi:hypothetical protein
MCRMSAKKRDPQYSLCACLENQDDPNGPLKTSVANKLRDATSVSPSRRKSIGYAEEKESASEENNGKHWRCQRARCRSARACRPQASAASNHFVRTYLASTAAGAPGACWSDANRKNNAVAGTYYYCASGPTQASGGQTLYGYNLWVGY